VSTTRAVLRGVEPGNDVRCVRCGKQIKFAARTHPRQVIANVYIDAAWNRVDHFQRSATSTQASPTDRSTASVARSQADDHRLRSDLRLRHRRALAERISAPVELVPLVVVQRRAEK